MADTSKELEVAVKEPTTYVNTWTRGVDGSFNDLKKEKFAIALASGKTVREAAQEVGVQNAAAMGWAKHDLMKLRKRALRQMPAVSQTFTVSVAMIVAELHKNAQLAREAEDFKSSNDALGQMYRIAKAEKSLLETFDSKLDSQSSGDVVAALQAHLSKANAMALDTNGEDA